MLYLVGVPKECGQDFQCYDINSVESVDKLKSDCQKTDCVYIDNIKNTLYKNNIWYKITGNPVQNLFSPLSCDNFLKVTNLPFSN